MRPELSYQLAWLGRKAVAAGLVVGSGGNLSARLAGEAACLVTGAGCWLDELTPADLSVVRIADGARLGGHPTPSSELTLHLAAYRARADVNAVVHLHPQLCVLLDALGQPVRLPSLDHQYYVGRVGSTPYLPSGSTELAMAVAVLLREGTNCVILGRHGVAVVADSVELAAKRALNLEEAARATYRLLVLEGLGYPSRPHPGTPMASEGG